MVSTTTEFFEIEDNTEYECLEQEEPVEVMSLLLVILEKLNEIEDKIDETLEDLLDILTDKIE